MSHIRQQKQVFAQKQVELLNEFQYTIIQDMENVLGIAMEFYAVEKIQNSLDQELVKVQKNRLILQYNLSNTIHVDQQQTAESKKMESELGKLKIISQENFTKIKQDLYKAFPDLSASAAGKILEDYHANNLSVDCKIIQKPMEKTNVKANFNQDVVGKILGAMQKNDQIYDEVRNAKQIIKFDDSEKITQNAINRFVLAKAKLQEGLSEEFAEIDVQQTQTQEKKQNMNEKQSVPEFVSLLFSGLANYFAEPNLKNDILLQGVFQITYETKIDLKQLAKHFQSAQKHLPKFSQFFEISENFLKTGEEIYNPCAILKNIKLQENEFFFLKQYQSDQKAKDFWQCKSLQLEQINYTLLNGLYNILHNRKSEKINFIIQDAYDAFLKKKIIELHYVQVKSSQTKDLLWHLLDETKYPKPQISISDNLVLDISYICSSLQKLKK